MRRSVVAGALLALLVPLLPLLPAAPAAADDDYEPVIDLTFPVSGPSHYSDDYHAHRSGGARRHQATDIMAAKMQHVHAAVDGVILRITGIDEPMPSWGYQLVILGDDGREYDYIHLNNDSPGTDDGLGGAALAYAPGIRKGVRVERGQWLGWLGDSGNAESTASHLHFEIFDPDLVDPALDVPPYEQGRINPYPSLEAARARGDVPDVPTDPRAHPGEATPPPLERLRGPNRVHTAVALSQMRGSANTVIVAPAGEHAHALVAAPLAGMLDAPVLLSWPGALDDVVADEVARLGARNAYLIGGEEALSDEVADGLRAAGVQDLARLDGADAAEISAAVARELASYPFGDADEVLLALGESDVAHRAWPDALSASALAARLEAPVLLVRGDALPPAVADVLAELGPQRITVVGGTAAIDEQVAQDAAAAAGGADVERLSGATRYGTSVKVAQAAVAAGLDGDAVWLATGNDFPDALAAGPSAARDRAPLLLVDGVRYGGAPESEDWLATDVGAVDQVTVVGGTAAVADHVADALRALLAR